jgi:hypothetical protein
VAQLVGSSGELARLEALLASLDRPGVPAVVDIAGEPQPGHRRPTPPQPTHRRNAPVLVYRKLSVPSRSALTRLSTRAGLGIGS